MADMGFTSIRFAIFTGALLILYYRIPKKGQWLLLLAASFAFYLLTRAEYLVFIGLTILTTYTATMVMDCNQDALGKAAKGKNRLPLLVCLVLNFGVLALCKICLIAPIPADTPLSFLGIALPLGISFFTFQTMGYVIDVYRGTVKAERNILKLALFVSYFPALIQGPISKYSQLSPQLQARHDYDGKQLSFGLQRMLWGYFKKLVIADRIAPAVLILRGQEHTGLAFGLLTILYAVQIYGDFTGGIDITLGLSQALGIILPENFTRPFFSRNIAEYWRRWHITLGAWMKEYIFYPVSVSRPMRSLSKSARRRWGNFGKRLPVYAASVATWFVTGIWHGLTPNFILWGLLNCAVIVLSEELSPLYRKFHSRFRLKDRKGYALFEVLRTFLLMNLIRVCDLFPDPGEYFRRLGTLFSNFQICWAELGLTHLDWCILAFGIVLMLAVSLIQEKKGSLRELLWHRPALRYTLIFSLLVVIVLMGSYGVGYDASSFIYNQF